MRRDNELLQAATRELDQEIIDIEHEQRNTKHFKHWARKWYHRYHDLPAQQKTERASQ